MRAILSNALRTLNQKGLREIRLRVDKPVIAVPTSVGYGANMNGISALLTMINSCANGIAVVNIDNGYGAGYIATQINRMGVRNNE